ncbi:MAG: DUF3795 domain-containing protein [Oscillospiraceae bacterium]|nr:DUF3795 domain-containing protein [Oscillospiraceae bacterium]
MDNPVDFRTVTPCGECCVGCPKKRDGFCKGCIESGGRCKEWEASGGCPIFRCAMEHGVSFCGLCPDFPCAWLPKKASWNPRIVAELTDLARRYREQDPLSPTK